MSDAPIPAVSRRRVTLAGRRRRAAVLFVAPLLGVLAVAAGWPLLRTIYLGFTDATLASIEPPRFVGFENFWYLFADEEWWRSVRNTLVFAGLSVGIETVLGVAIALVLDARVRGRGLVRAAVLVPWAIPTIVSAKMWGWMFHDLYGVINEVLRGLGLISVGYAWTAEPGLAMLAVITVDVWKTTPFMALLVLAALQSLPTECYEAARIDGIRPLTLFTRVTLPLIRPALLVAVIFRSLDALRIFDVIYVLTPNNPSTMSMSVYARRQLIDFQDTGYGSAAASLLFAIVALLTVVYVTVTRVRVTSEAHA